LTRIKDYFVSVVTILPKSPEKAREFIEDCCKVLGAHYENYELVVVDDASDKNASGEINALLRTQECIRYLRLSRPFGKENAISAGLDNVIGDIIVTIDPLTDPPEKLPEIVKLTREVGGVVFGVLTNKTHLLPWYYSLSAQVYTVLCNSLLRFKPPANASHLIGLTRDTLNAVIQIKSRYQHNFLRLFSPQIGFPTSHFKYEGRKYLVHDGYYEFIDAVRSGLRGLLTNSSKPLRIVSIASVVVALGYLVVAEPADRILAVVLFFIALQLFAISEYIARLIYATRQHPHYFIAEERNSSVMIPEFSSRRNVNRV